MMVRVGIEELRQEHAEGDDGHSADLANLQDMLVTIERFQRQSKPTALEGQAALLELMSHTQTMKSEVFKGFDASTAIKDLKEEISETLQKTFESPKKLSGI